MLSGFDVTERNLAENMLSENEIIEIARAMGSTVQELLRVNSPVYKENKEQLLLMNEQELAAVIATEPTLIKRPIVKADHRYVVGFDADKIRQISQP